LPGEEFAKRRNFKRKWNTCRGAVRRRLRAVLRAFQPNATRNANRSAERSDVPGLTIPKSVAEKIHGVVTTTKSPKMH
jgi:hypothetical protein